jgi:DNA invertase Pin-like site-specific DNA recombinase
MLPIRCAIYIRVSSRHQIKGVSLEDQEHACRAHAARAGWTVVEPLYIEPGQSAFSERLDTRVAFRSYSLTRSNTGSMWCWSTS